MQTTKISVITRYGKFCYDFRYGGKRVRRTTHASTEEEAKLEALHALSKLVEAQQVKLGETRPVFTWGEAVIRYIKEKTIAGKVTLRDDIDRFKWMERQVPGIRDLPLTAITRYWVDVNVREPIRAKGRTKKTINAYIQTVQHVLNLASRDWETEHGYTWLEIAPVLKKEKLSKAEKKRIRYLTRLEAQRLIAEAPEHTKPVIRMALATGLRMSNILGMQWEWVDLSRQMAIIPAEVTKAGRTIPVPFSEDALEVIREQRFKHPTHVFPYKGKPMKRVNGHAWKKTLQRAGIENFKFHDLRHTWASWHIQNGTTLEVLQELGSWEDAAMVKKYAHLNVDSLRKFTSNSNLTMATNQ